jgi:hypothetical protein
LPSNASRCTCSSAGSSGVEPGARSPSDPSVTPGH